MKIYYLMLCMGQLIVSSDPLQKAYDNKERQQQEELLEFFLYKDSQRDRSLSNSFPQVLLSAKAVPLKRTATLFDVDGNGFCVIYGDNAIKIIVDRGVVAWKIVESDGYDAKNYEWNNQDISSFLPRLSYKIEERNFGYTVSFNQEAITIAAKKVRRTSKSINREIID